MAHIVNIPDMVSGLEELPWGRSFEYWPELTGNVVDVQKGLSRHPVIFINLAGSLYALKELPPGLARIEYDLLSQMAQDRVQSVDPAGFVEQTGEAGNKSILVTHFLDFSIPYRFLFMQSTLGRYRKFLLDAMAGLLVQLHLAGFYWGDCSLSNTLFRRDAGTLQAYLVDAETAHYFPNGISASHRADDLEIMQENVSGDLIDLEGAGLLTEGIPVMDSALYIRNRYQKLWEEINHEDIILPEENYRIQERIRALNSLGFSVGDVELTRVENGQLLQMRVFVTDRNFHHDQLHSLTGLGAQEMQATQIMNEIQELKANLSNTQNRSVPLSAAVYHWLMTYYTPTIEKLKPHTPLSADPAELYCQVLEHKWFLSEREKRDVGHDSAAEDYLNKIIKS